MEFKLGEYAGATAADLESSISLLAPYMETLSAAARSESYESFESSLHLPIDGEILNESERITGKLRNQNLKYVFLAGIGGSDLGAKAVYDALHGANDNSSTPKLVCIDTVSSSVLAPIIKVIETELQSKEELVFVIVSKSGTTLETIANAEVIFGAFSKKFSAVNDRIAVITDKESLLDAWAKKMGCEALHIPKTVGGRYSIFVDGLLPLALCGIDTAKLREGARDMVSKIAAGGVAESAAIQFAAQEADAAIHDLFLFAPELESLGKWWRQLFAESLGKDPYAGMLPTVSIGSTDLHSMLQFYLGGPHNRFTTFVTVETKSALAVPLQTTFDLGFSISNKPVNDILDAIQTGVKESYKMTEHPYTEIVLRDISEFELGAFMQFKMIETMLLAKLMGVNAFDQPAVEHYKDETRKILAAEV